MKDTRPEARDEYYRRLRLLTNEERSLIVLDSCSAMRKLVRESLRHLPEPERTVQTFRRYYALDFTRERLDEICAWIRERKLEMMMEAGET